MPANLGPEYLAAEDEYRRRAWRCAEPEFTAGPEEIQALAGGSAGIDTCRIELREAQEKVAERLRQHREAGHITKADFLLLVGNRVYGQSAADYACGAGLDYQVAEKRRQRAEAVIRRLEGKGRIESSSPISEELDPVPHALATDRGPKTQDAEQLFAH